MNSTDYKKMVAAVVGTLCMSVSLSVLRQTLEKRSRCNRACFSRAGYHQFGLDKEEHDRNNYAKNIMKLRYRLDEAYQQLQQGQFRYALYDADIVMRETVKMIVRHEKGDDIFDNLLTNMKTCEREHLLGEDVEFINRLYEVYHICECDGRQFTLGEHITHKKVYFVIMQIKDLLNFAEDKMVNV